MGDVKVNGYTFRGRKSFISFFPLIKGQLIKKRIG